MSIRRNDSETHRFITKVLSHYRLPLDPDGTSELPILMLTAYKNQQIRSRTDLCDIRRVKSIKVLGHLNPEGEQIFHPLMADKMIPGGCKLKDTAEGITSLRKARVESYADLKTVAEPYLVCLIPSLAAMPIEINESEYDSQMSQYRVQSTATQTTTNNQLCTHGAFITTFHRDTM